MEPLSFADFLHPRPRPRGLDVVSQLHHFAIITYAVDPARLKPHIHERFKLDTVTIDGDEKALLSVVPFIDVDFTSAVYLFPKLRMGQTNYRIYVIDQETNKRAVWFLGTTLDSWTQAIPYYLWKLPWHRGRMTFDCQYNNQLERYDYYRMRTASAWAPAEVELVQTAVAEPDLSGFCDLETGLICLTHPLTGFYFRRDGKLGSYQVWHERLTMQPGQLISASFGLLERLEMVTLAEQQRPHSVLLDPHNEFTVYLPPRIVN